MTILRLLADDLTGAMDTAAQFVGLTGPVAVRWDGPEAPVPTSVAVDCGTREGDAAAADAAIARWAGLLRPAPGTLAYLKLDSLLRGHAGREIAGCLAGGGFSHCLVVPAFPFQGRTTRHGRQWVRTGDLPTGEDIAATLAGLGHRVTAARAGDPVPPGISLWDAETEADLDRIVAASRVLGPAVLWCGSGGLAGALAGRRHIGRADGAIARRPLLGLFGTDHPVTAAQLDAAAALVLAVRDGDETAPLVRCRLETDGTALVRFHPPQGLARPAAAAWIERELAALTQRLDPPASVLAGGGETVRSLCRVLGASSIEVTGQIMPGVPRATMRGGRWDGIELISKSGAFGDTDLLLRLAAGSPAGSPFRHTAPSPATVAINPQGHTP